jgi:hypothetical protein
MSGLLQPVIIPGKDFRASFNDNKGGLVALFAAPQLPDTLVVI